MTPTERLEAAAAIRELLRDCPPAALRALPEAQYTGCQKHGDGPWERYYIVRMPFDPLDDPWRDSGFADDLPGSVGVSDD